MIRWGGAVVISMMMASLMAWADQSREITAVYRVPEVRQMSGIAVLHAGKDSATCVAVSDKTPHLYQLRFARVQPQSRRDEPIPARVLRTLDQAVDLEDVFFDRAERAVWVVSEHRRGSPAVLYRVPIDKEKKIRSFELAKIVNEKGNGAECAALVPAGERAEIWIGKERLIPPSDVPPIHRYRVAGTPSEPTLTWSSSFKLDLPFHRTQSGFAYDPVREVVWVISRELRTLFALRPTDITKGRVAPDALSFRYHWDELLGNPGTLGMVEGIAVDDFGWLYATVDNNNSKVGMNAQTLSRESRLLVLRFSH